MYARARAHRRTYGLSLLFIGNSSTCIYMRVRARARRVRFNRVSTRTSTATKRLTFCPIIHVKSYYAIFMSVLKKHPAFLWLLVANLKFTNI